MNSLAVIRANDNSKLRTTLHDLVKYGHMSYSSVPKKLEHGCCYCAFDGFSQLRHQQTEENSSSSSCDNCEPDA